MKTILLIIGMMTFGFFIPPSFASCIVNEDWYDAPCLDSVGNGYYNQDEVDQWTEYYSYKGSEFMEAKKIEMINAINEERLNEWVEESIQNENVWSYYYYSGRAPNAYSFGANFEIIPVYENENSTIVDARPLCEPIVDGICVPPEKSDFRDDETLNSSVIIIIQSLGAVLIIGFIIIYAIKKRAKSGGKNEN